MCPFPDAHTLEVPEKYQSTSLNWQQIGLYKFLKVRTNMERQQSLNVTLMLCLMSLLIWPWWPCLRWPLSEVSLRKKALRRWALVKIAKKGKVMQSLTTWSKCKSDNRHVRAQQPRWCAIGAAWAWDTGQGQNCSPRTFLWLWERHAWNRDRAHKRRRVSGVCLFLHLRIFLKNCEALRVRCCHTYFEISQPSNDMTKMLIDVFVVQRLGAIKSSNLTTSITSLEWEHIATPRWFQKVVFRWLLWWLLCPNERVLLVRRPWNYWTILWPMSTNSGFVSCSLCTLTVTIQIRTWSWQETSLKSEIFLSHFSCGQRSTSVAVKHWVDSSANWFHHGTTQRWQCIAVGGSFRWTEVWLSWRTRTGPRRTCTAWRASRACTTGGCGCTASTPTGDWRWASRRNVSAPPTRCRDALSGTEHVCERVRVLCLCMCVCVSAETRGGFAFALYWLANWYFQITHFPVSKYFSFLSVWSRRVVTTRLVSS